MARKIVEFSATKGRDAGKTFILNEMSAEQAEWFAIKCFLAVGSSGTEVPDEYQSQGVAGLLAYGVQALFKIRKEDAKPLLDEMMDCVLIKMSEKVKRPLVSDDIEEVSTRFEIRKELLSLHTGFFSNDDQSTSESAAQAGNHSSATLIPRRR